MILSETSCTLELENYIKKVSDFQQLILEDRGEKPKMISRLLCDKPSSIEKPIH